MSSVGRTVHSECWRPPPNGNYKINWAFLALKLRIDVMGLGLILGDSSSLVISTKSFKISMLYDNLFSYESYVSGTLDMIQFSLDLGLLDVFFELKENRTQWLPIWLKDMYV